MARPKQQTEEPSAPVVQSSREPANLAEAASKAAEVLADGELAEFRFGGQKYIVRREGDATVLENRGC